MTNASPESLTWRRPARCASNGCVEAAHTPGEVWLRDGKNPTGPALTFTVEEWREFTARLKAGDFDV